MQTLAKRVKICCKCGEEKSLDAFYVDNHRKDGRYCVCRGCEEKRKKVAYKSNPDKHFYWQLQRLYKVTPETYKELLLKQDWCCAICGKHQRVLKAKLGIDHNHKTGQIRGLLCQGCNYLVGRMEQFKYFDRLLRYLEGGDCNSTDLK